MGYVIHVGQKKKKYDSIVDCKQQNAPYFPANGVLQENFYVSSASNWDLFCDQSGLRNLFFDPHPVRNYYTKKELCPLTLETLEEIRKAKEQWKTSHPNANPEIADNIEIDADYPTWILAVLLWFEWWVEWAINNCTRPHYSIK